MSGKTFPTINPATGEKLADIAEGDKADVDLAVKAAKKAFARGSEWRNMNPSARAGLMHKLADLLLRDADILANLETLDNGKSFPNAKMDVMFCVYLLKYYAGWCDKVKLKSPNNLMTVKSQKIFSRFTEKPFPLMVATSRSLVKSQSELWVKSYPGTTHY